jgi:spore germination protein GerM
MAFGEKNKTKNKTKTKTPGSSSGTYGFRSRDSSAQKKSKKKAAVYIFWLFFFILIICLFIVNMDAIRISLRNTGIADHFLNRPVSGQDVPPGFPSSDMETGDDSPGTVSPAPFSRPEETPREMEPPVEDRDMDTIPASEIQAVSDEPPAELPVSRSVPSATPRKSADPPPQKPPETRERSLYLMRVDPDGILLRTKVIRNLPVTNSPMTDVLNALLQGPSATESSQGLISLIPRGTRILSVDIGGSTAKINFNENFLFNEYGVEGYAGQLRQVVWTATEFPNIKDVQILIEGRKLSYLGESIWIGDPVGRESR